MTPTAYAPTPDVVWVVERRGLRLLHTASRGSQMLAYPQAAIWDLLCRNAPRIPEKVAAIAGLPLEEAERLVSETLAQWARDGFLAERGR